ncbi:MULTISPECIES: HAD-IIIC family phosphatase [unclassified Bradyrhizobium]|uniref:HAD-IIIC family phosphatase n=1 Tax=unclassified Bradyrhizobium TaxID=2631580 RepID=UPI0017B8136C|nr:MULTISPECIES: HAD-IIIC family phosphatase [unclassified Bradyrhizobium]MBB4256501.1 FkbH-like protein [Bradyrhizobium sp. CIR3A]NYG43472.1 FkbH-like protein [Bradyrhizobium sp. IAR9]
MNDAELKSLALSGDAAFWGHLAVRSRHAMSFSELFFLSTLRKKAKLHAAESVQPRLRLALIGGYNLYPLHELVEHLLSVRGVACERFLGEYDNFVSEVLDDSSPLYAFKPDIAFILPNGSRCRFSGSLLDAMESQREAAVGAAEHLLSLARTFIARSGAAVILANLALPAELGLGSFRSRTLGADWSFRKAVNLELGLRAPAEVQICDVEFLSARRGITAAEDARAWYESKQLGSPDFLVDVAQELSHLIASRKQGPKKVLVLDLDHTLWGGVIAEDGIEGIELGDSSPRGEAFKAFQKYLLALSERGVLLAVCSKNDHARAVEVFEKHPEMVLRLEHFAAFKANWDPKSDNLQRIADELHLGLDSFVFADDNPAEIEIVRQFQPLVEGVLLGPDPAEFIGRLQAGRHFEPRTVTEEDLGRTAQYRQERRRTELAASVTDMPAYLASLEMRATIKEFDALDLPRIAQLIARSNQFNLTTVRRSETEIQGLLSRPDYRCFTMRLEDRFGDSGLISVVIAKVEDGVFVIDTWLMSCRVLKRQVEDEIMIEIFRIAEVAGCAKVRGIYLPTAKNGMVAGIYEAFGFVRTEDSAARKEFELEVGKYQIRSTKIRVTRRAYEAG